MRQSLNLRAAWSIARATTKQFTAIGGPFLASALAFDVLLYCVPFLLLIVSSLGYMLAGSDQARVAIQDVLQQFLPSSQQPVAENLTLIINQRHRFGVAGVVLLFVFSTVTFGTVRSVLDRVFDVTERRHPLLGKLIDFLLMLVISGLLLLTVGARLILAVVRNFGDKFFMFGSLLDPGWAIAGGLVGYLLLVVTFYVLYRYCPARRLSQRALWLASAIGAAFFELSKWAFAWYVALARITALVYGTLAGLLFFLLWIYYASFVFILAAAFGWTLERRNLASRNLH
jgi:membrane protein